MSTTTLSPEERQQHLNDASDQYMSGDMSDEEFEHAKMLYASDYRPAMLALAKNLKDDTEGEQPTAELSVPAEFVMFFFAILLVLGLLLLHRYEERPDFNSNKVAA